MVYRWIVNSMWNVTCYWYCMLLTYMPTKKYIGFVAIGFVLVAYMNLSILPVAIVGLQLHMNTIRDRPLQQPKQLLWKGASMKMSNRTPVLTKKKI